MEPLMISSKQNPRIKALLALQQKSSERRRSGLFVVEGQRELGHCLAAGYEVVEWCVPQLVGGRRRAVIE